MNEKWQQPSLAKTIEGFKKYPQSGINLDILEKGIRDGKLSAEELAGLNETFVIGYNKALHACFPQDAFDILRGQNMIAGYIPPQEQLDLDREWEEIAQLTRLTVPQQAVTTEVAFKNFKQFKPDNFPNYEAILQKISIYISECIRRAHKENNPELLQRVIPTFKLLAYLHKLHERTHYWCESEFDVIVRFGVDPEKMEFRYLKKDEVTEKFFNEATVAKR
jgi:hypothetical protein